MKGIVLVAAIASALLLTGCETTEWEVSANCEGGSSSWKCSGSGKIKGTFEKSGSAFGAMDATNFALDLDGSTVGTPSTGSVTISLVNSATNSVQAAKVFSWFRSGSRLYLTDPAQVNAWAQANAGTADSVAYQLQQFTVTGVQSGSNMFSATAEYAGIPQASSITTFSGRNSGCRVGTCQVQ